MKNENLKTKNNTAIVVILFIIILLLGVCVGYLVSKNSSNNGTRDNTLKQEQNELKNATKEITVDVEYKEAEYSDVEILDKFLINNTNVLDSMFNYTHLKTLRLKSKSVIDDMVFANIDVYGSQFDENYLFIYDNTGKMITHFYLMNDTDNDDNQYKYNGDFEYNSNNKTLTFSATIWFGDEEESTGTAFNNKLINELSKSELEKFGNYSYAVRYEYKLENGEFKLAKKKHYQN